MAATTPGESPVGHGWAERPPANQAGGARPRLQNGNGMLHTRLQQDSNDRWLTACSMLPDLRILIA